MLGLAPFQKTPIIVWLPFFLHSCFHILFLFLFVFFISLSRNNISAFYFSLFSSFFVSPIFFLLFSLSLRFSFSRTLLWSYNARMRVCACIYPCIQFINCLSFISGLNSTPAANANIRGYWFMMHQRTSLVRRPSMAANRSLRAAGLCIEWRSTFS